MNATTLEHTPDRAPPAVSFGEALRFWLKLGFVSFGGPVGQIAIMHRELVERRRWISDGRFLHALNYCMVLPGPEAQQLATYIGWLMHGPKGGIAAGALFVLPSLVILIVLSWVYLRFGNTPWIAAMLEGVKPAVVALVFAAAWRIGGKTLSHPLLWLVAIAAFIAVAVFGVGFPWVIGSAALVGLIASHYAPGIFKVSGHKSAAHGKHDSALIDDHTPTPLHAQFLWQKPVRVSAICLALWALPMLALHSALGASHTLPTMAGFFTKAALLSFGGAYAVLPYVYQGSVGHYGWLSAEQMMAGLALGETTPGPLIMIVAFVGFVGGWSKQVLGPDAVFAGAALAATVATYYTFLPSFMFILAGGPWVETTRGMIRLSGPLTCVSAAIAGVIVSLAAWFAWHVFWPDGTEATPFAGRFAWFSVAIAIAGLIALTRYKTNPMLVIGASALAGLVQHALR